MVLSPGDCFGLCSLTNGGARSQTTIAKGDVALQMLHRNTVEYLQSHHQSFNIGLIKLMYAYMRQLSEYFASATVDHLACRIAKRLLHAPRSSAMGSSQTRDNVQLSQGDIALMVGASRQAVNRVLQRFQKNGLIAIHYGGVQIFDIDRLQQVAA